MTRVTLDLTDNEMLALGYCVASGLRRAREGDPDVEAQIASLFEKVYASNALVMAVGLGAERARKP